MSSGLELKPATTPPELDPEDELENKLEMIEQWFIANYEDPAENTPYESREGGYQWIWGGPYDLREELQDAFPEASEEVIDAAVEHIEHVHHHLIDWAPSINRVQPDDIEDDDEPEPDQPEPPRLDELRKRLDELEGAINEWRGELAMLGHNRPPEEFRTGLSKDDLDEAQQNIVDIRKELDKPNSEESADSGVLRKAASFFSNLAKKIFGVAKFFGSGFVSGLGKEAGTETLKDPHALYEKLHSVAGMISDWAHHVSWPF